MPNKSPTATCPTNGWTKEAVTDYIDTLLRDHPGAAERSTIGSSYEGRDIELLKIGNGGRRVLAWSQMHGDEQTYTTVVLNTLRMLIEAPESPLATDILAGCTLLLIPLLNPDGAARRTRVTAQGVDMNRDARDPDTPEGRVLRQAVLELRPDFGFNLHNQDHRRWLRSGEGPVSISLLVPPPDRENSQTPSVVAARRVAASITRRVRPLCDGRVTRYGADYMPRAFGEWVQSQGVATVLLEAGGWPGGDIPALEELNYQAFVEGLRAIATDDYQASPPDDYDQLARAGGGGSFDLIIQRARVIQHEGGAGSTLDLGINKPSNSAMPDRGGDGRVVDVGDLYVHRRDAWIDAEGLICLPGRVSQAAAAFDADGGLDPRLCEQAAQAGVTTLLLTVDEGSEDVERLRSITDRPRPLVNVGFLLRTGQSGFGCLADDLPTALIGVVGEGAAPTPAPTTIADWRQGFELLGRYTPTDKHEIDRGSIADLVLAQPPADGQPVDQIERVLLGGTTIVRDGAVVRPHAGAWLRRGRAVIRG